MCLVFIKCYFRRTDLLWENLLEGGSVMMPLDRYEWSPKYGWLNDRFGISWQISLDKLENTGQQISPAFLFMGGQHPLAEEAVHFYTSVFDGSEIRGILRYKAGEGEAEGSVRHAQFRLQNQTFMIDLPAGPKLRLPPKMDSLSNSRTRLISWAPPVPIIAPETGIS